MYERSAIVLERYLSKIFGQDDVTGIKADYQLFTSILEEMEKYQAVTEEEEKVIEEFDAIAQKMQTIQKKQEVLCSDSVEQEEERNKLFNDFDQDPSIIEKKLLKIEKLLEENSEEQKRLREEYMGLLNEFMEKQKMRNRCSKIRRTAETNHMKVLNETVEKIELVDPAILGKVKQFSALENEEICQKLNKIMLENGKNEKIKFDEEVIKKAVATRIEIAKKEAECYLSSFDKLKKIMTEIEGDTIRLAKYQKNHRDIRIKLQFLELEKEYVVSFLDNERMTAVSGEKMHYQMMRDACEKYDVDIRQINNLYELILREMSGKATKKSYNELYNSTYLANIEETEKNFNQEVNNIKASIGTIINTNYWRIESIKNIYELFNELVQENFERDLTEFMPVEEAKELKKPINKNENKEDEEDDDEWFISNDEIDDNDEDSEEVVEEDSDDDWFEDDDEEEEEQEENNEDDDTETEDEFYFDEEDEDSDDYDKNEDDFELENSEEDEDDFEFGNIENDNNEEEITPETVTTRRDSNEFEAKLREKLAKQNQKQKKKTKKYEELAWIDEDDETEETRRTRKSRKPQRLKEDDEKGIFNKIFKK